MKIVVSQLITAALIAMATLPAHAEYVYRAFAPGMMGPSGLPGSCVLPWGEPLASGASTLGYATETVAYGDSCSSVARQAYCNEGLLDLNGALHKSCTVAPIQLKLDFENNSLESTPTGSSAPLTTGTTLNLSNAIAFTGTGSLYSSTTSATGGSYIAYPANAVTAFGTGDFTVSASFYRTGRNSGYTAGIISLNSNPDIELMVDDTDDGDQVPSISVGGVTYGNRNVTVTLNAWHTIAITRKNGIVRFWYDGTQLAMGTYTTSISSNFNAPTITELAVSQDFNMSSFIVGNRASHARQFRGYIDNILIRPQDIYSP